MKISPLLAQCLLNRGLSEPAAIADYLEPRLKHLADPFRLPNMVAAVDRLFKARETSEPLVIFGDYDVDGVTSTALLTETLRALGWKVNYYLPNRMDEGYGLSQEAVENCLAKFPVTLLLAVDCGSTATAADRLAARKKAWMYWSWTHHQVFSFPRLRRSPSSIRNCRTVNSRNALRAEHLPFKLAHAVVKRGRELGLDAAARFDVRTLLDLVARWEPSPTSCR